jgi:hypothetical protein
MAGIQPWTAEIWIPACGNDKTASRDTSEPLSGRMAVVVYVPCFHDFCKTPGPVTGALAGVFAASLGLRLC